MCIYNCTFPQLKEPLIFSPRTIYTEIENIFMSHIFCKQYINIIYFYYVHWLSGKSSYVVS